MMDYESADFFALNQLVREGVDGRLEKFFAAKKKRGAAIDTRTRKLIEDIESVVRRGGKRIRPTLAIVGYHAVGGKDIEYALDAAVAVELLHAFMLVHDDVMDQDLVRHGAKNLGGIYRKRFSKNLSEARAAHAADSMAILGGDLLLSWVFEILADHVKGPDILARVIKQQVAVTFDTAAGQQLDVLSSFEDMPTMKQLMKIPHYKTGLYSFVAPLQFGALIAGKQEEPLFTEYGLNLGIAFQLIDDDLGMFGSRRQTGKPVQSDLEENKSTLLRYYGLKLSRDSELMQLQSYFGKQNLAISDVQRARKILTDCGARAKVLITAENYGNKATRVLDGAQFDSLTNQRLTQLAQFCLSRKH